MLSVSRVSIITIGALILTALLGVPTSAQDTEGTWAHLEDKPNCTFWDVYSSEDSSVTWSGGCQSGHVQGQGVLVLRGKSYETRIEGIFQDGKLQGVGTYVTSIGYEYSGSFKDGKPHGHGKAFSPKNYRYEGEFKNGVIDGRGIFIANDKVRYEGEIKNGAMHGHGIFELLSSRPYKYEGAFQNNQQHGHGMITFPNGSRHEGEFSNDKRHGHGVATSSNGDRCEGEWEEDIFKGPGVGWKDGLRRKCRQEGDTFVFYD